MSMTVSQQLAARRRTFLTGATGDIGSQLLNYLIKDASVSIRVMLRRQSQIDDFKARLNISDTVLASLDDSVPKLSQHMSGCDTLLILSAAVPQQRQHGINAIDAALAEGSTIKWIVKISAADARDEGNTPWVRAHAAVDAYLKSEAQKRGCAWTILSPSAFMQNILTAAPAIRKGFLPQTAGNGKVGWIDTGDIAAVASAILLAPDSQPHHGQTYILTGPALLSMPDLANTLTRVVGHRVRYLHLPGPIFGLLLRFSGQDSFTANGLMAQFIEIVRPNLEGIDVSDTVEKITGQKPTSFEQFCQKNKYGFKGYDLGPWLLGMGVALVGVLLSLKLGLLKVGLHQNGSYF